MTTSGTTVGASRDFDPFDLAVLSDPLPHYARLREESPVHYLPDYDAWAVSRYADVYDVLADPDGHFTTAPEGPVVGRRELSSEYRARIAPVSTNPLASMNALPRPYYSELRQAFGKSFRRGAVARLADFIREQARDVIGSLHPERPVDLVTEVGGEVTARTVCHILEIPMAEARRMLALSNAATRTDPVHGGLVPEADDLRTELREMARGPVERRRAAGATGDSPIIDSLIRHTVDGRPLTDDEILVQLRSIMLGGTETVPKVFGHGLMELAREPAQRRALLADLDVTAAIAVQEMLRYCAPGQWFLRSVVSPVTVGGMSMEAGQRVLPLLMSANRDPRAFEDPDRFVWNRKVVSHLGFGQGFKFCPGSHLARLELQILVEEFLTAFPAYEVDESASERPPSHFQWAWSHVRARPGPSGRTSTEHEGK